MASGRCKSSTKRVERSTRVPTAELAAGPDDEVAFPVAGHRSVFYLGGALADHDHVRDLASLLDPALATATPCARAQAAGQLTAQFAAALDEEGLVDGLVAHLHHRIVGELQAQARRDLLGRPQLLEPLGDLVANQGTMGQFGELRTLCRFLGPQPPVQARRRARPAVGRHLSS